MTTVTDVLSGARRRDALAAEEFAHLLENSRTRPSSDLAPLVGLARSLTPAGHLPEPTFRAALRAQLVAEAAARVPVVPVQRAPEAARPSAPRWRTAVAALAVASAVTGVGAAAASSQALPGDALYGLKLRVEAIQLSLAGSDLERGRALLEDAATRIDEAERLAQAGEPSTRDDLAGTLSRIDRSTTEGAAALVRSYRESGDPEPLQVLARFAGQEQPRLAQLADRLDPALRAQLLQTIDFLAVAEGSARAILSPAMTGIGEAAGPTGGRRARDDGRAVPRQAGRGALPPSAATRPAAAEQATPATPATPSTPSTPSISGTTGDRLDVTDPAPPVTTASPVATSVPTLSLDPTVVPVTEPLPVTEALPAPSVPQPSVAEAPAPTVAPLATPPALPCVSVPPVGSC